MSFEQDRGVWSDARMFDVAKGVLVTARRCGLDEALTELVGTAERHHMKGVRRVAGPGRARCRGFRLRRPRCHRGRPRHLGTPVRQAIDTMNTTTDRRVAGSNAGPARRREFGRNADLKRPPTVGGFGGSAVLRFCDSVHRGVSWIASLCRPSIAMIAVHGRQPVSRRWCVLATTLSDRRFQ